MGVGGAADYASQARRQQAHGRCARGGQRPDVCAEHRLPMASDPEGPAAARTVHDYFDVWAWDGTLDRIHHALYVQCRELANRESSPSAAIIDSQSVKSAEKGGRGLTRMATMRARSDNEDVAPRSRARSATS